jgi:hypothetical protein
VKNILRKHDNEYVESDILTEVVMQSIFWAIHRIVCCMSTNVSEEHATTIFRVEVGSEMFL